MKEFEHSSSLVFLPQQASVSLVAAPFALEAHLLHIVGSSIMGGVCVYKDTGIVAHYAVNWASRVSQRGLKDAPCRFTSRLQSGGPSST